MIWDKMPDFLITKLSPIFQFFWTEGSAGGLIGAFLILAASYFINVGIKLREYSLKHQGLFVFAGSVAGSALYYHDKEKGFLFYLIVGAGWPYVALSLKISSEILRNGFRQYIKDN